MSEGFDTIEESPAGIPSIDGGSTRRSRLFDCVRRPLLSCFRRNGESDDVIDESSENANSIPPNSDQPGNGPRDDSENLALVFNQLNDDDKDLVRHALTVLIDICRNDEVRHSVIIDLGILRVLLKIMEEKKGNSEIIKNCCELISILTEGTDDQAKFVRVSGILSLVFKHLNDDDNDVVKHALTVLYNIYLNDLSGPQTVFDLGTLPVLLKIMEKKKGNSEIAKICCKLLMNMMALGPDDQKMLVSDSVSRILSLIFEYLNDDDDELVVGALRVLFVFTCDKSVVQFIIDMGILRVLLQTMEKKAKKPEVFSNCCKLIGNLTEGTVDQRKLVKDSGILHLVFKHLNDDDNDLAGNALWAFVCISCIDVSEKQFVIDMGILQVLLKIMEKHCNTIFVGCMLINNVMEGTDDQKQAVIDNGLLPTILKAMLKEDSICQDQCSEALANLMNGTEAQIQSLIDEKPMAALAAALTNIYGFRNTLDVIYKLLSTATSTQLDTLKKEAKEAGVVDHLKRLKNHEAGEAGVVGHLKNLQKHTDEQVRNYACFILTNYFAETDGEGANLGCVKNGKDASDEKKKE